MILDIKKYYPIDCNNTLYKLVGVINQIGTINGGHYYSYCYNANFKKWYNFNDEHVTEITEETVLNSKNAYILFYQKADI